MSLENEAVISRLKIMLKIVISLFFIWLAASLALGEKILPKKYSPDVPRGIAYVKGEFANRQERELFVKITGYPTLFDLILAVGGLTDFATNSVLIERAGITHRYHFVIKKKIISFRKEGASETKMLIVHPDDKITFKMRGNFGPMSQDFQDYVKWSRNEAKRVKKNGILESVVLFNEKE